MEKYPVEEERSVAIQRTGYVITAITCEVPRDTCPTPFGYPLVPRVGSLTPSRSFANAHVLHHVDLAPACRQYAVLWE